MKQQFLQAFLVSSILMGCSAGTTNNDESVTVNADVALAKGGASTVYGADAVNGVLNNIVKDTDSVKQSTDLLLAKWQGPFQGVPAFDRVTLAGLLPAMEKAMATELAEIDLIANNSAAPTFENTIVAMEKTGSDLNRPFFLLRYLA